MANRREKMARTAFPDFDSVVCNVERCEKKVYLHGRCKAHYNRQMKYGDPLLGGIEHGKPLEFICSVSLWSDPHYCVDWPFARARGGYGSVWVDGRVRPAHIACWEAFSGRPAPAGMQILHRCDRPCCINPHHLFLGTRDDNMADMVAKGRQAHGERHNKTKYSDETIYAARMAVQLFKWPNARASKVFGPSCQHISGIINNRCRVSISGFWAGGYVEIGDSLF